MSVIVLCIMQCLNLILHTCISHRFIPNAVAPSLFPLQQQCRLFLLFCLSHSPHHLAIQVPHAVCLSSCSCQFVLFLRIFPTACTRNNFGPLSSLVLTCAAPPLSKCNRSTVVYVRRQRGWSTAVSAARCFRMGGGGGGLFGSHRGLPCFRQ